MAPADLHARLDGRLFEIAAQGARPWHAGVKLLSARLDMDARLLWDAVWALGGTFASVRAQAGDPRCFGVEGVTNPVTLAPGDAAPALLLSHTGDPDGPTGGQFAGDDLIAWSLQAGSRRVWRWTGACAYLGELRPDVGGTTRLFQDPHAWLKRLLSAAGWQARARAARTRATEAALARGLDLSGAMRAGEGAAMAHNVEQRLPDGALVLDPAAIAWTRSGVLAAAEAVEIVDAPVDGPLGRALVAMNPRLGTLRGIPLRGLVAPVAQGRRRAA